MRLMADQVVVRRFACGVRADVPPQANWIIGPVFLIPGSHCSELANPRI